MINYDESVSGDISSNPTSPLELTLAVGSNTISASTGGGEQEYVTLTIPEGLQLDSVVLESYTPNDVGFIGVQQGDTFTEPLDDSAIRGNILGYTLFGNPRQIGTDILDEIGQGLNAIGFEGSLPSGNYTFALQQLGADSDYTLSFNVSEVVSDLPVINFFFDPQVLAEDDNDEPLTFRFTVDGEIPEGGLQFNANDGYIQFFTSSGIFDGNRETVVEPDQNALRPLEVGETEVLFNLTGAPYLIDGFLFDDIIEEEPFVIDFEILPGEGYIVGENSSATVTIVDGDSVIPGSGPTVSLSVNNSELTEGNEFTVSFDIEGEIPEEGLTVFVDGDAASLSEFNIFGENGIDPATDIVGLAGFPEADDDAGGFFATITENQASITLSVFDDGPTEGAETLTFELANGEEYEVEPDAASISLTINDGGEDAAFVVESGITSVALDLELLEEATGLTLVSADSEVEPFSEDFQVGFAILEETDFSLAPVPFTPREGTIEHSGTITLDLGGTEVTVGEFSLGFDENRVSETASGFFVADTLSLGVLFDIGTPGNVAISGEDLEISGADLLLSPEVANALGLPDLIGADVGDTRVDALVMEIDVM